MAADGMASAYLRGSGGPGSALVALNAGDHDADLDIRVPDGRLEEVALSGLAPSPAPTAMAGGLRLTLPARSGRLFAVS